MPINLKIPTLEEIFPVSGIEIGVTEAGILKPGRRDLTLFRLTSHSAHNSPSNVAGVFTRNRFCAAPIQICKAHLHNAHLHHATPIAALLINTGNANACTGETGLEHARTTCRELAQALNVTPTQILPFSTGVVLEPLPIDRIIDALPRVVGALSADRKAWLDAAYGIMTTDTQPKISSHRQQIGEYTLTFTGISKGAGMIRPNMATMLGFLATDVGIAQPLLTKLTHHIANQSFNRITVDGDTSTNDAFMIMATGQSGLYIDTDSHPHYAAVCQTLTAIALELAQKIVRDAEGATKFITIQVEEAHNTEEALKVAYAIAHSPLVKTAFYACDPNFGRILVAIGYAGIEALAINGVSLWVNDIFVTCAGNPHPDYREEAGQRVMQQDEIQIRVALGRGRAKETVYTCDLSHEYVTINAHYRS